MKTSLRRLALAGLVTSSAVVAGVLVAPGASAAITTVSPRTAFNTETARTVTVTTAGSASDYRFGGSLTLTGARVASATYTVAIMPNPAPAAEKSPTATLALADTGAGLGTDGPLDAGDYGVTTRATGAPVVGAGSGTDSCPTASCFTVQPADPAQQVVVTGVTPGLQAGQSGDVTLTGENFERRSRIDVLLPGGAVDRSVTPNQEPFGADGAAGGADSTQGITTRTTLQRRFTVAATAPTGARDVRVTNLDGRTGVCLRCFSVDGAPLSGTSPTGGNNDPSLGLQAVVFTGTGLNTGGVPALLYTADPGSSTRDDLTLVGRNVRGASATSITADFDLRNAAPQDYTPVVRNPDGSRNACTCTFAVAQTPSRTTTVTSLDSDTATVTLDNAQPAGTTRSFLVTGSGFARGTRVVVSGTGVTTTGVQFLSPTQLRATLSSAPNAAVGARNVTAVRTDAVSSDPCTGCYSVTAATSASPSATPTATTAPTATASPSPSATRPADVATPTVSVSPSTITPPQRAVVSGTADPGSTVELLAYSRPRTDYVVVRAAQVADDGTYSFQVGPSGNTRLYVRTVTPRGTVDSPSVVLTVRTSINLKVTRTGVRTYRFTGSTLPKRPGQTVNVRYRSGGRVVVASKVRVAPNGTYNITRRFGTGGTFDLYTDTGVDLNNAAGVSRVVRTAVR